MKTYEVTIGIPVYNVEKYIRLTMDSAMAQTFESIEFLILDDCGTDKTMDIVREYQNSHPRGKDIRIVRQSQNEGLGRARNRIMDEAQGTYLYYLDGDDAIEPQTIQLLYNKAKEFDADMVYGSYKRVFTENDVVVNTILYPYPYKIFCEPDEYACYAYDRKVQTMTWNYLIKVDILRKNHLRVAPVGYGEDFTFTVDLPTYVTRVILLPDITYSYYVRDVNIHRWDKNVTREMMDAYIKTIDEKKRRTSLKVKPYYARRCEMLLMYDFSFLKEILKRRNQIHPRYTNRELRNVMWHPMSLMEILRSRGYRIKILGAYIVNRLPPAIAVFAIKFAIKIMLR
ncbi:glycosyltransferase family 2 protein [Prevotella sp. tf2-5]|uniref:glycosyltransferase family 2 protein n=1 Tax=Prevotella sp. tf2-5 TaxID=1761889 RepID=UPI0008ED77B5|nr:glycosyltransferase family 2 protein [Prevotella sp. tf2-5]SFO52792.1 Glycosyl transferase family 2 [Prevotella sp. tf2-5]